MGIKNQRAVYEWVNISDDQVYECFFFFFFSKTRYMNGVGFEILARKPVPQLPLPRNPPPPTIYSHAPRKGKYL